MGRPKMTEEEKAAAKAEREAKAAAEALAPVEIEPLSVFIARVEVAHVGRDVFAVEITHPEASEGVYPGRFSGIRLRKGEPSVTYSDGTKQ